MFINRPKQKSGLDEAIEEALNELKTHEIDTARYSAAVDQVAKLYKIKTENQPDRLKKDTLAIVAGNLLGILVIVSHERAHIVTSKALSFVQKVK